MSVLRRNRARPQADVEHQIRHELAEILPILRIDHCAIELDAFDASTGTAVLHVMGGCKDCDASAVTFMQGIEVQLKRRVSELRSVIVNVDSTA
ncbi:MAG TPA: NifU family protein [Gemmatimonadaceae bacterium]|jgi:Fe-S cluster biogenesis protein NfuA|nr:NifU family protein [Gemmatimonadaceae bacterium]